MAALTAAASTASSKNATHSPFSGVARNAVNWLLDNALCRILEGRRAQCGSLIAPERQRLVRRDGPDPDRSGLG